MKKVWLVLLGGMLLIGGCASKAEYTAPETKQANIAREIANTSLLQKADKSLKKTEQVEESNEESNISQDTSVETVAPETKVEETESVPETGIVAPPSDIILSDEEFADSSSKEIDPPTYANEFAIITSGGRRFQSPWELELMLDSEGLPYEDDNIPTQGAFVDFYGHQHTADYDKGGYCGVSGCTRQDIRMEVIDVPLRAQPEGLDYRAGGYDSIEDMLNFLGRTHNGYSTSELVEYDYNECHWMTYYKTSRKDDNSPWRSETYAFAWAFMPNGDCIEFIVNYDNHKDVDSSLNELKEAVVQLLATFER